jgi:hypothetical protein
MPRNYRHTDADYWEGSEEALPGIKARRWQVGETSTDDAWAMVLDMDPGFVIPRHAHNFDRFEVVVKGSIVVGEETYGPGDVMTADAHEFYGPKVCGPNGCMTIEFFARKQGDEYLEYELEDGSTLAYTKDMTDYPENLAQKAWIEATRRRVLAEVG